MSAARSCAVVVLLVAACRSASTGDGGVPPGPPPSAPAGVPALFAPLVPDAGVWTARVSDVRWRAGESLELGFIHASGASARLEVRFFAPDAPAPLVRTTHLAIYVLGPPDAGTSEETELLARALAAWLDANESDAGLPPLSALGK